MRKCPKCGFEDSPLWENCRFKRDLQLMRLDDFKESYPHLAKKIETEKYLQDGQFLYHKTRLYVLRKEPANWSQPFWEQFEAHKSNRNRNLAKAGNQRRKELQTQTVLSINTKCREEK